jgi:hypothetical protein
MYAIGLSQSYSTVYRSQMPTGSLWEGYVDCTPASNRTVCLIARVPGINTAADDPQSCANLMELLTA